jgi:hypothetical protein
MDSDLIKHLKGIVKNLNKECRKLRKDNVKLRKAGKLDEVDCNKIKIKETLLLINRYECKVKESENRNIIEFLMQ